jgi:hypothetical protein
MDGQMNRIVAGVLLIVLGGLFLLDTLDVLGAGSIIAQWWPLAIVGIGVIQFFDAGLRSRQAMAVTAVGVVLLGFSTDVLTGDMFASLWPVGLIALGIWIAMGRGPGTAMPPASGNDRLDEFVLFSGKEIRSTATAFEGGRATAVFGGIDLDLRGSTLRPEGAVLEASAVFGGIDLVVPSGLRVEISGPAIFGGWEDNTTPAPPDAPRLAIKALAVFGGIEVKSDPMVDVATWPVPDA